MNIVFVLFPNLTQLDFTGPLQVLSRLPGAKVYLAAEAMGPVSTDTVMTINPTVTFGQCPQSDIICVPGGFGTDAAIQPGPLLDFVKQQAKSAKYITSVCTGAFVLGAAGLLRNKKATTHWAYHDHLKAFGAYPVKDRVVRDGNIFTGGGVTAGIDFALTLVAEIAGVKRAQSIQLGIEYDPAPPFEAGSPDMAPEDVQSGMSAFYTERSQEFERALKKALA